MVLTESILYDDRDKSDSGASDRQWCYNSVQEDMKNVFHLIGYSFRTITGRKLKGNWLPRVYLEINH